MIRKLRIKIVLVIVLVAAVMLGVIFGMSYTMTRQDLRAQSLSMMQAIAANPFEPIPPGQSRQVRLPYFVLRTSPCSVCCSLEISAKITLPSTRQKRRW